MSFFDELGKKISNAGQAAIQKTQEMASIAKLNGSISDEEKRINNAYTEIGKLYASLHAEDYEEGFAQLITGIKDAETKIANFKKQIQEIKGVVRCEKCGAEVASNVAFCSSCGAPMAKPEEAEPVTAEEVLTCSQCGTVLDPGARFCTSCGKPVDTL
ncbi:MAG: zinc ribbon domain-containing protein [Clostridiales bacterium]|nr:zinc ribbon domain-containing protein [Clostridiales bacterium]